MAMMNISEGAIFALIAGMAVFFIFLFLALYVYCGLAFMAIGKKAKVKTPELAWIPFVGPAIITFQISKMHWWPWLLLIVGVLPIPGIGTLASIGFWVFATIWLWKTFEELKRPGWWAILCLIPPAALVLVGIAAWAKK